MKYSININQVGIADAGFADKTDLVDWALIDYIFAWQNNPSATKIGSLVWISYKHLISEMPLLGLKTKQAVSARISKLKQLGLIIVDYDREKRLYASLSEVANCDPYYLKTGASCLFDNISPPASKQNTYKKKKIGASLRLKVYKRDGYCCVTCCYKEDLSLDHIIPEVKGGSSEIDNLQTLCRHCNAVKGSSM